MMGTIPTEPNGSEHEVRRCRGERGAFTTWFLVMVVPMMLMAGLVFDGGQVLSARREALDVAQNAARAGAQAIDGGQIRQGNIAVDPALVHTVAQDYLTATGFTGTVTVSGTEVTVLVTQDVDMALLGAIGVQAKTVTGTATARIVRGVEGADT
jgi:Flp pilus assembly protein TadG